MDGSLDEFEAKIEETIDDQGSVAWGDCTGEVTIDNDFQVGVWTTQCLSSQLITLTTVGMWTTGATHGELVPQRHQGEDFVMWQQSGVTEM